MAYPSPQNIVNLTQPRSDSVPDANAQAAKDIVTAYADAKGKQDVEAALAVCTPDFRLETVPFGLVAKNAKGTRAQLRFFFHVFPDYKPTLEGWAYKAHGLACWGTLRMTMRGALFGIGPTGRTAELPFYCVFTLRDDRLASEHFFFDFGSLCSQLGLPRRRLRAMFRLGGALPDVAFHSALALGRALGHTLQPEATGRALTPLNLLRAAGAYLWRGRARNITPLLHLARYAGAFERTFKSNDWSSLRRYFKDDASRKVHGAGMLDIQSNGADQIVDGLRQSVAEIDRRFDRRIPELLEGPRYQDGGVWFRWRLRLQKTGLPDLVVDGDHLTRFDGAKISSLEENIPSLVSERVAAYMNRYESELHPVP